MKLTNWLGVLTSSSRQIKHKGINVTVYSTVCLPTSYQLLTYIALLGWLSTLLDKG